MKYVTKYVQIINEYKRKLNWSYEKQHLKYGEESNSNNTS